MKVKLIYPIESAHGSISKNYYIRTLSNGKQIVAQKPNRKGHVKTEREAANQRRFAEMYAKRTQTQTIGSGTEVVAVWSREREETKT